MCESILFPLANLRVHTHGGRKAISFAASLSLSEPHFTTTTPLPRLFIGHIFGEHKQRLGLFSCAAAQPLMCMLPHSKNPLLKLGNQ